MKKVKKKRRVWKAILLSTLALILVFGFIYFRSGNLTEQARKLLDFQQMNIFFSFNMLGYALMALAAFFAGLPLPMLRVFQADSPAWIGVAVLEFWCAYFCPVAILSLLYFRNKGETKDV